MSQESQDLSSVLNRTALLESVMDQVIEGFCRPRQEAYPFFVQILLHSSIMPLGSKVKLISAIAQEASYKLDRTALHEIVSTRNAFAHHPLESFPTFRHGQDENIRYMLAIVTNSGQVKRTDRAHALAEFDEKFESVLQSVYALRGLVDDLVAANMPSTLPPTA